MSLLRDIQATAIDSNSDIATLLRMCKILAFRLGNNDFKNWVDKELNGYSDSSDLPKYRKLKVESVGHFLGPFGRELRNAPIPPYCIPEEFRDLVTISCLTQPISSYASLIGKDRNPIEKWSAEMVAIFGGEIYENMNCISAWKVIPSNYLIALVDTIKTRILNFSLEIEVEAPDAGEAPLNKPPLPQEKVSQVFNTFISGNVQNVATGGNNFRQKASFSTGSRDEIFQKMLDEVMQAQADLEVVRQLTSIIEEMRESQGSSNFGKHYQSFTSILADHIQIFGPLLAPYLPVLAQMVSSL